MIANMKPSVLKNLLEEYNFDQSDDVKNKLDKDRFKRDKKVSTPRVLTFHPSGPSFGTRKNAVLKF